MTPILIHGGLIVNEGRSYRGYVLVRDGRIAAVGEGEYDGPFSGERIDASGKWVMAGAIDDQVHFREPGLTYKGDIASESAAAVAGGVTSFMDMPNVKPPTVTLGDLERKFERAAECSAANYSFYLGATDDNIAEVQRIDPRTVCGVKVFMGSSTGNMLVNDEKALAALFDCAPTVIATHCEYEPRIRARMEEFRARYGDGVRPEMHPLIRDAEACYRSSAQAVELADRYSAQLNVLHVSSERELALFDAKPIAEKSITAEVCVHHLWFCDEDYAARGNRIKWNPAIKSAADRDALRRALAGGKLDIVATDHAPHTDEEKMRPYWQCPSGGPSVQHSLAAMLELAARGLWSVEQVVEKMCHAPAVRYGIVGRGFLREGYRADIAIVDPARPQRVDRSNILYKCGWSPFEGETFRSSVVLTLVNGRKVFENGIVDPDVRGERLEFEPKRR